MSTKREQVLEALRRKVPVLDGEDHQLQCYVSNEGGEYDEECNKLIYYALKAYGIGNYPEHQLIISNLLISVFFRLVQKDPTIFIRRRFIPEITVTNIAQYANVRFKHEYNYDYIVTDANFNILLIIEVERGNVPKETKDKIEDTKNRIPSLQEIMTISYYGNGIYKFKDHYRTPALRKSMPSSAPPSYCGVLGLDLSKVINDLVRF